MSKARDLANAGTALTTVSATELGYLDGVTSAVQTQINSKEATLPSQTGNTGKYLTTDGSSKSWGTVSQYALPSQTGNSGKYLTTNGSAESWGTVSQPVSFSIKYTPPGAFTPFMGIATNGSNIIVAGGNDGVLVSSTDSGATWSTRTSNFGVDQIRHINYGNGLFVAVGQNGKISTSSDGITWTARTAGVSTNSLYYVAYLNSLWIAVGNGANGGTGGITTSSDGITWTKRSTPSTMGSELKSVTYGNGYYVAVGNLNGTAGCYSTNGTSWSTMPMSLSGALNFVHFNGSAWMACESNGNSWRINSTNPTGTWSGMSSGIVYSPPDNTGNAAISVYGDYYYAYRADSAGSSHINRITTSITGQMFTGFNTQIFVPYLPGSNSNVLTIDSNGKLWYTTYYGHIYSAQL